MTESAQIYKFSPPPQKHIEQTTSQTSFDLPSKEEPTGGSEKTHTDARQLQNLIRSLNEVFAESKERNWDGEGSEPVSDATYYNATRLLSALPISLPSPEILPDNDGYIEFEWRKNERNFSLYVTDTNLILFAGFYGKDKRISGRFTYDGTFPNLAILLAKDVYKKTSRQ